MTAVSICAELRQGLGERFVCRESVSDHGPMVRIRTPFLYPDGDVIELFCTQEDGVLTISDLGETTGWLRMQTAASRRSAKQRALIEDTCQTCGVEFFRGMLLARCRPHEPVAAVVLRVAQAALRVADLWFTFRTRAMESLVEEVSELLQQRNFAFERHEKHAGRSGRTWTVDLHVRTPQRSSLVYVLATGNRAAARSLVEHVVAAWYDLSHLAAGPEALQFVSLFDDTVDVWAPEDFRLVEGLSTVAWWSAPERFLEILTAA